MRRVFWFYDILRGIGGILESPTTSILVDPAFFWFKLLLAPGIMLRKQVWVDSIH